MNNAVRPNFKIKFAEIRTYESCEQCTRSIEKKQARWVFLFSAIQTQPSSPKQAMLFVSFPQLVIQLNQNWVFSIIFLGEA